MEDTMSFLNALTLTQYASNTVKPPAVQRRNKLVAKLNEQIKLATDADYKPVKLTWHRDGEGRDHRVEVPKRVKRWWTEQSNGTVLLTVRYGSKPLELAKGKNAIVVNSLVELPTVLAHLKAAAEKGEFDTLLEQQVSYGKRIGVKPKTQ
jgi:hypothetical protein